MEDNDKFIHYLVKLSKSSIDRLERKEAIGKILDLLKPFRFALAKKFANKGVPFDDITQQIDLKLIEAIDDYDEKKDPSALRHLVSKARNGVWNYYRKEMNYFNEDKHTISLDAIVSNDETGWKNTFYEMYESKEGFNENEIIEKILFEEELEKLTPHQREILFMVFIDDMTQYDIAEELQINQANVSRAKKRGIENIKNNISPLDAPDETH